MNGTVIDQGVNANEQKQDELNPKNRVGIGFGSLSPE
jgi:hypothetical protein